MIFLSHNRQDKPIVRKIAETLEQVFGRDNVFYDEWSIQPGNSIIGKMNEGLEKCQYFFFFVSQNSLNSKMVEMEWQSAIMKQAHKNITFVPIRLDNSILPSIILSTLYIDLYTQGLEIATRQIIDVITGQNTYRYDNEYNGNLIAKITLVENDLNFEIEAQYYMEPHCKFLFVFDNDEKEIDITQNMPSLLHVSRYNNLEFDNGEKHNGINIISNEMVSPGFPFEIILKSKKEAIKFIKVMHAKSKDFYVPIPHRFIIEKDIQKFGE